MHHGKNVNLALVGKLERLESLGRAAPGACDTRRVDEDGAALSAFGADEVRLGL
jgi:hypothetical protein